MSRIRSRTGAVSNGSYVTTGGIPCHPTFWNHTWYRWAERCTDEVLLGDGHPFETTRIEWIGTPINSWGPGCTGTWIQKSIDLVPQSFRALDPNTGWHQTPVGRPSNGELAATLLARTSPSRPVVDLPIAIAELRELPELIHGYGNGLIRAIARGNLSYQFGIRPMISDLSSLLNFQDAFANRMRELEALKEGTLRRKRALFRGSAYSSGGPTTVNSGTSNGGTITCDWTSYTSEDAWGFVRWKPSIGFPQTDDALRRLARRAVLGLTVDLSTFWNLIPWSWLVDWCSSTGDYLLSNRNLVPCTPTGTCIMSHRTTTNVYTRVGGSFTPTDIGPWIVRIESKSRSPATPTLDAHLPILSLRQLSILGSIGISKYRH